MRALSGWLELMLAEIAQRQEQARAAAEESKRRSSGDPTAQQPTAQQPTAQQPTAQQPPVPQPTAQQSQAHSTAPARSGARKTRGSTVL